MRDSLKMNKYHGSVRTLHWVMMVLLAIVFVIGFVMVEFEDTKPWALFSFHKSTGVLIFLLLWLRLITRWSTIAPPLPNHFPTIIVIAAKLVHGLLYVMMLMMPMSGYALSNVHGYDVDFYGLALPKIFPTNPDWEVYVDNLHSCGAWIFLALLAVHICGVIYHQVKQEDVLSRMS